MQQEDLLLWAECPRLVVPILVMSSLIPISGLWAEINATRVWGCESGPLITSDGVMLISAPRIMRTGEI